MSQDESLADEMPAEEKHFHATGHYPTCEVYEGTQRGQCTCTARAMLEIPGFRIGYLEEALRHINDLAIRGGVHGLVDIRAIALRALESGDPLTCPEAL